MKASSERPAEKIFTCPESCFCGGNRQAEFLHNHAGKNLSEEDKSRLEKAKKALEGLLSLI